jgi:uncharacterized protein YbjT (DUF2867 family)
MNVTVLGATGKTGRVAAEALLAAGAGVKAIARSPQKLSELAKKGAATVEGDVFDAASLTAALRGSDAVYAMIPGNPMQPDLLGQYARAGESIASAVRGSGVKKVVFLSSLGAERPSGVGPIVGLNRVEGLLKAIPGIDLLLLRPGYFYENLYGSLGLIKGQGINGGVINPDTPMTMIASRDIGAVAAEALEKQDFSGVTVRELAGPRLVSMGEATRILGRAIGKPDLPYVQFPDAGFVQGLSAAGFSEDAARLFAEMGNAFNQGLVAPQPGSQKVTTSTTFEAFADEFARAYRAG